MAKRASNNPTKPNCYFMIHIELCHLAKISSDFFPIMRNLTIEAIVDTVNYVFGGRFLNSESVFVLLDHIFLSLCKTWDVVYISYRLVWSVRDNLSSGIWVHALNTEVRTDIGIIKVDD